MTSPTIPKPAQPLPITLLCFLTCCISFGCKQKNTTPTPHARHSKTSHKGYPLTVLDGRGKTLRFLSPPKRIVVAGASLYTEIIADLQATKRLVGIGQAPDNPPALKKLETFGKPWPLNLEKVLALRPDLVLGTVSPYRQKLERIARLRVFAGGSPQGAIRSLQDIRRLVFSIDLILHGNIRRATRWKTKTKQICQQLLTRYPKPKKAVRVAIVYLPKEQGTTLYVTGSNSPAHEMLQMAGGVNVFAAHRGTPISIETLIQANPDVLLTAPSYTSRFLRHQALSSLRAIQAKRVIGIHPARYTSTRYHKALQRFLQAFTNHKR